MCILSVYKKGQGIHFAKIIIDTEFSKKRKAYISLKSYLMRNFAIAELARDYSSAKTFELINGPKNLAENLYLGANLDLEGSLNVYLPLKWDSIRCRTR